mgnify:CR=1 FL=1
MERTRRVNSENDTRHEKHTGALISGRHDGALAPAFVATISPFGTRGAEAFEKVPIDLVDDAASSSESRSSSVIEKFHDDGSDRGAEAEADAESEALLEVPRDGVHSCAAPGSASRGLARGP